MNKSNYANDNKRQEICKQYSEVIIIIKENYEKIIF